jgi:hypothetical protein
MQLLKKPQVFTVISDTKLVGILTASDVILAVPSMLSMVEEVCPQKQVIA